MQKCSICEKVIYGHPTPTRTKKRVNGALVMEEGPVVCGSCPLNKSQGGKTGKSFSEVRMDLAKIVADKVPVHQEVKMPQLKVKSNIRNRTILLDGRYVIVFDDQGIAKIDPQYRELMEREMTMKPGRFSFVDEEAPVSVEVEPALLVADVPDVAEIVEEVVPEAPEAPVEEPLVESKPESKKASKKK